MAALLSSLAFCLVIFPMNAFGSELDPGFVKSILKARKLTAAVQHLDSKPTFLMLEKEINGAGHRRLWDKQPGCDYEFTTTCLSSPECVNCFATIATEGINWASVAADTPCHDVVDFLLGGNHCLELKDNNVAIDKFCKTFDSCVVWDEDNYNESGKKKGGETSNSTDIDCSKLTSCDFPGFHDAFLGDGICHDSLPGCYNSEVCGYDGGDCCPDTCKTEDKKKYVECGAEGFACRDPNSEACDSKLTKKCVLPPSGSDAQPNPAAVDCGPGQAVYRIIMYDSFGDGWDATRLTLSQETDAKVIFEGSLEDGAQGTSYVCLSTSADCYHIAVNGGVWGNEVSWEVKPQGEGMRAIAGGGSPMDCTFPVAGGTCTKTCDGQVNKDPIEDPDYKTYKHLYDCIQKKCLIQVGACTADRACAPCFTDETPDYCFANVNFNAVVDCGLCECTEDKTQYCATKTSPGKVIPSGSDIPDEPAAGRACSPQETMTGTNAVLEFSRCTEFDQIKMMVTDFDQNNFGTLDVFEKCAHSFHNEPRHGGFTALRCMGILYNAIDNPVSEDDKKDAPKEAISNLARLLYNHGEEFCECASKASIDAPLCPSFMHFKTLLYESLDACQALDEIDCDAWNEFYEPCKENLEEMFSSVDFKNPSQCDYVKSNCGGAGTFPAFRRLDCGKELTKTPWDFYNRFARDCLQGQSGTAPRSTPPTPYPVSTPFPTPVPVTPKDNNSPDSSDSSESTSKQYVPKDDDVYSGPATGKPYNPTEDRGSSHFWRNIVIIYAVGGVAVWYYRRRQESFSFVRYRRAPRNFGGEGSDMMFSGISMDGSSSFEPPTLPPPPSAVPDPQHP